MRLILLLLACLIITISITYAQDPLDATTFTSTDGTIVFDYPSIWQVDENGIIHLATELSVFETRDYENQATVEIIPPAALEEFLGDLMPDSPDTLMIGDTILGTYQSAIITEEPRPTNLYTRFAAGSPTVSVLVFVYDVGVDGFMVLIGTTAPGRMIDFEAIIVAIADSLTYYSPNSPESTGEILWSIENGSFAAISALVVVNDGTIYAGDVEGKILVINADGELIDTIEHTAIANIADMKGDTDGNLWIADSVNKKVHQLSPNTGTVENSWGTLGTEEGQFDPATPAPTTLAIRDTIYTYDNPDGVGRLQIWDTSGNILSTTLLDTTGQVSMAFAPDNTLYLADSDSPTLTLLDGYGTPLDTIRGAVGITDLFITPDGHIYIALEGQIRQLDRKGQIIRRIVADDFQDLTALVVRADGSMVVANSTRILGIR